MSKTDCPRIAVSIVTWNSAGEIRDCLNSLKDLPQNWEIWVADNASSDETAQIIKKEFPNVTLIANADNLGFAKANNQIIARAATDYVLLLNPDTETTAEELQKSLTILENNPQIGLLGVRLVDEDGNLQISCYHFPTAWLNFVDNLGLYRFFSARWRSEKLLGNFFAHDETRSVDWVMGAFMFVRRAVIEKAGVVPEDYFMFAEDMDWCYLIRQNGYDIGFAPAVSVTHKLNRSAGQLPSIWRVRKTMFSKYLFCYNRFGWLKTRFIQLTDLLGLTIGIWRLAFRKPEPTESKEWKIRRQTVFEALKFDRQQTRRVLEEKHGFTANIS